MKNNHKNSSFQNTEYGFVDLFSGAGGMSFGFHSHPSFRVVAAADAEVGKPSMGMGSLQCNSTYAINMGIEPVQVDLSTVDPHDLRDVLQIGDQNVTVLSACAPCTGFSRANPLNHTRNDHRNDLVQRSGFFAVALDADILIMENARELLSGNFRSHYVQLHRYLEDNGYKVHASVHMLTQFGLPQIRERALVIAVKENYDIRTLSELWDGYEVDARAKTVRRALSGIRSDASLRDAYPAFSTKAVANRLAAIPKNGGSWCDLIHHPLAEDLLTDAMKRRVRKNQLGSHPDVYGRIWWDKPCPTIKRECAHIGNGRYAHPECNRLCSIREMAILQGFPNNFEFNGRSLSNNYRHIGDAVPPLISFQLAGVCDWILSGRKPSPEEWLLKDTHLRIDDIIPTFQKAMAYA
jgi:DNA (cytosine-5)-methyltransferase 1